MYLGENLPVEYICICIYLYLYIDNMIYIESLIADEQSGFRKERSTA